MRARLDGLRKQRLIDIAEPYAEFGQHVEEHLLIPARMPYFESQGVITEAAVQLKEISAIAFIVIVRPRELQKQGSEPLGGKSVSQAVSVAAELGIADRIADNPKTVEELAAATSCTSG